MTTLGNPADIPAYLNEYQDECHYVYVANPSSSVLYDYLYLTIVNLQVPASIGIANTTYDNWYYETAGHSLIVNGIYSDYSAILISDPLGGIDGIPYFYEKSANIINLYCTRVVF